MDISVQNKIEQAIEVHQKMLHNIELLEKIENIALTAVQILKNGGRILLCGNGGSAADAQHIAAELSGRFSFDRAPLDAEALHCNTSYLTAVANDYSFDMVYGRLVEAKGRSGDMLIAISTSGNSMNIINAIESAKQKKMYVAGLTGENAGKMTKICDALINIPCKNTPIIQQLHILVGHILCEKIENEIFKKA